MGSTNWDAHHGAAVVRGIAEPVSVSEMRLGTTEPKRNLLRSWPTSPDLVEVDLATGTSPVCIGMIGIEPVTEATWTWSRSSVDKMALSVLALDALPAEVLASLFDWLLGVDLLRLSHASPRFLALLHANAALWAARLSHHYGERKASLPPKRRLLGDKSIRFRGRRVSAITDKGACVDIRGLVLEWGEIVAFDLWFSLLPADEGTLAGGVLLGVQTTPFSDPRWPFYHQQFIVVDRQRNLYCSVISNKQLVATALETERWYHLALMFDGHTQRVLLDGKLVSSAQGSIHHEAYSLRCMQLGTGCVSAGRRALQDRRSLDGTGLMGSWTSSEPGA